MSKHKAPTQVTIAPTEEESAFAGFVHRAWKPFLAISIAMIAVVAYSRVSADQDRAASHGHWDLLTSKFDLNLATGEIRAEASQATAALQPLAGTEVEPWAIYLSAVTMGRAGDWSGASAQLSTLQSKFPQHVLNKDLYEFQGSDKPESIAQYFARVVADQQAWASAHPELLANPAIAADAPRVKIVTDAGSIVVGLYPDRAPKHCENFLKLCSEGFYDGTLFHRVIPSTLIQAGDPNTKNEDQSLWGAGGPGYTIEKEESGLFHFKGTLAAARKGQEPESSGSQFYITVGDVHGLDEQYVAFGTVLEGLDVATTIGEGEVTPPDSPVDPIKILSTQIL